MPLRPAVFAQAGTAGEGSLIAEFRDALTTVTVKVRCTGNTSSFEVQSVDDPAVEEVSLLNLVLKTDQANAMSGVAADGEFAVALRALNLQTLGTVGGKPASVVGNRIATAPLGRGQGRPGRRPRLRDPASAEGNARKEGSDAVAAGRSLGPGRRAESRLLRLRRRLGEERRAIGSPWPNSAASSRSISSAGSRRSDTTPRARTPFPTAWPD